MKITAEIKTTPKLTAKINEIKLHISGGFEDGYSVGYDKGYADGYKEGGEAAIAALPVYNGEVESV